MLSICVILTGASLWLLGGLTFSLSEGWSYTDGYDKCADESLFHVSALFAHLFFRVYFSIVTLATIGYGDLIPSSQFGQAFLYW